MAGRPFLRQFVERPRPGRSAVEPRVGRQEKVAPDDSGEGVSARLGTGEDAHSRPTAPPAARGSPIALVLGVGAIVEVGAGRDAVGGAIHESECLWVPCARSAGAAARRRARQREAEGHEAAASACTRWRRRSHRKSVALARAQRDARARPWQSARVGAGRRPSHALGGVLASS
ncbi:DEAD-box ATP-dependent RNA helicase 18 [Hordeum vulgare]|nr:DEAD-box ATP-dependent RNA helicase 18 [Hordeum vulgare]